MDFKTYTNIIKALLHFRKSVETFYCDVILNYDGVPECLKITLHRDFYSTELEVKVIDETVMKIKLYDPMETGLMLPNESRLVINFLNQFKKNDIPKRMSFVKHPESTSILLGDPTEELSMMDINFTEEQVFQMNTITNSPSYEQYINMRDLYYYFSEFFPEGLVLIITHSNEYNKFNTYELKEFCTTKIWGMLNLA